MMNRFFPIFFAILATLILLPSSELAAAPAPAPPASQSAAPMLARTPPMGWNTWNKFQCNVDEGLIRESADALVSTGMRDAGYQYLVIDDCWQVSRDAQGNIVPDPKRFPSGIKKLADYVHSKGLKFGIYSDAGTKTCGSRPGSKGHEVQDAKQYAAWGVDYLKYDWCNTEGMDAKETYGKMSHALRQTGRAIVLSLCEWGQNKPWTWAPGVGQLWRTTGDIQDCWDCNTDWGGMGLVHIVDLQEGLQAYAGPDHWNDPDMLQVGNGGMTASEYRAHFSLWAIMAAPLMAGNDLRNMSADTKAILLNQDVIAVDQDPLGVQGYRVRDSGFYEVWMRLLAGGERAVVLFNRGNKPMKITATWQELGYGPATRLRAHDLWTKKDLGTLVGKFEATVSPHDVVMLRLKPE